MDNCIIIEGIETNNLKGIDITLEKKAINLIIGPSGSGKTSLAYDTVAQIGQHEFMAMFADDTAEPSYVVRDYKNMVAAVPLRQKNANNNMHSTIGTYFGLNRCVSLLYAVLCEMPETFFTLNKAENLCEKCHGIGTLRALDLNRIVDYGKPLAEDPIRCWNIYKEFYQKIIVQYCESVGIDPSRTFRQLSKKEAEQILYGSSDSKFKISYKKKGATSSRTTKYHGIMTNQSMIPNFKPSDKFYSDIPCDCCYGRKYSAAHNDFTIEGLSIGAFMTLPFENLQAILEKMLKKQKEPQVVSALTKLYKFTKKAIELKLGHLNLHRAIPTLSGGELQRLRMVQVFNSQLNDLLIVLDEPLAGLSGQEKATIYGNIIELAKHHTVLIVDHSDIFVNASKRIYALGPGSGTNGGQLIDYSKYLQSEAQARHLKTVASKEIIDFNSGSDVYQYKGAHIQILQNSLNLIVGSSGVGKSTLLREYFPQQWDEYLYINQNMLDGGSNSNVATALDIAGKIADVFAKKAKQDPKLFSNHTGNAGACPICNGSGYVEYGYDTRTKITMQCEDCSGTGFNKALKKYNVNGKTIFDIWDMTIDQGVDFFRDVDPKIAQVLEHATDIMLGHVRIGQPTATLSGGENIRIKILSAAKTRSKIIGIDEPFKGLSHSEIFKVAQFLEELRAKGKTIVVIDHSEYVEQFFSRKIALVNQNQILVGLNK